MFRITFSKKTAATVCSLIQHAVSPGIWRAIRNTMLDNMNVHSGPERAVKILPADTLNYFLDRKIGLPWPFVMEKCGGDPNLVGDFELLLNSGSHMVVRIFIITKYFVFVKQSA
jgi:hypothetical protein